LSNTREALISVYENYEVCTKLRDDFIDYLDLLEDSKKNYNLDVSTKERQQDIILSLKWVPVFMLLVSDAIDGISPSIDNKLNKDISKLFKIMKKKSKIIPFSFELSEAIIHKSFLNARPAHLLRQNVEHCHFYAASFSQSIKELKITSRNIDIRWNELFTVNLDGSRKSTRKVAKPKVNRVTSKVKAKKTKIKKKN
jgi:hypothetical protein